MSTFEGLYARIYGEKWQGLTDKELTALLVRQSRLWEKAKTMKTPHRLGNNGEAPFDPEPGIVDRIRRVASDIDGGISANPARTEYSFDPSTLDGAFDTLNEIADELDKWQRDHGEVL